MKFLAKLKKIETILGDGKILESLNEFESLMESEHLFILSEEFKRDMKNQVILLRSRCQRAKTYHSKGTLKYEDFDYQLTKITESTLNLIEVAKSYK